MPLSDESPSNQTGASTNETPSATSSSTPSTATSPSTPSTPATDKTASSSSSLSVVSSDPMARPCTDKHVWEGMGGGGGNVVALTGGGVATSQAQVIMPHPVVRARVVDSMSRPRKKHKMSIVDALNRFNSMSREEQIESLPFCLVELTLEEFHAQCDALEGAGCSRCEFRDGGAWIYELPHAAHDRAAQEVIRELDRQLGNRSRDFAIAASPRCDNNDANWSYEPDGSLTTRRFRPGRDNVDAADSSGNRWPNLIVEVAYSESEQHVRAKALDWLNTAQNPNHGVQRVIVIKIEYPGLTYGQRTLKAWRYERGADNNPVQEIEFRNHGPNNGAAQAGIPGMQLHIPVRSLYLPLHSPDGLVESLSLDLFYIRTIIEEAF